MEKAAITVIAGIENAIHIGLGTLKQIRLLIH